MSLLIFYCWCFENWQGNDQAMLWVKSKELKFELWWTLDPNHQHIWNHWTNILIIFFSKYEPIFKFSKLNLNFPNNNVLLLNDLLLVLKLPLFNTIIFPISLQKLNIFHIVNNHDSGQKLLLNGFSMNVLHIFHCNRNIRNYIHLVFYFIILCALLTFSFLLHI